MAGEKLDLQPHKDAIRDFLTRNVFFLLSTYLEENGITDDADVQELHQEYLRVGKELDDAGKTPEQLAEQANIAREEAEYLWGPIDDQDD